MKKIKILISFLLLIAFVTSCEKEVLTIQENSELNTKQKEIQSFKSITDVVDSGIDIKAYINSLPKQTFTIIKQSTSQRVEDSGLQFFSNAEEFTCSNLPTEDFEESNVFNEGVLSFYGPIDENSDNSAFSPGDILPGVIFNTRDNDDFVVLGANFLNNSSVIFGPNTFSDDLIIDFTTNNVNSVSMNIFCGLGEGNVEVEIFGNSGLLGITTVFGTNSGTYFAVNSVEPIKKIVIISPSGLGELIDDLSFGTCDSDGDGILNEDDPFPNSNMSATIEIDGCYPGIENIFVEPGTTMMDQIDELIAEINEQYDGENGDYLHRRFTRKLSGITYYWRRDRLITRGERNDINDCATNSNIPFYYIENRN